MKTISCTKEENKLLGYRHSFDINMNVFQKDKEKILEQIQITEEQYNSYLIELQKIENDIGSLFSNS